MHVRFRRFSFFSLPGATVLFFLFIEKEKNGGANQADSTRKGHAASVTLLRREQLHKVVRPYIPKYRRGAKSQKRADEGIGPYNRCGRDGRTESSAPTSVREHFEKTLKIKEKPAI